MNMPGRKYSIGSGAYRYGFNGKENDKDISEGGQDYGMRIYDRRLARFLSVDPLKKKYPMLSSYQFASNTPIFALDVDGLELLPYLSSMFKIETNLNCPANTSFMFSSYRPPSSQVIIQASNVPEVYKNVAGQPLFDAAGVGIYTYGKFVSQDYVQIRDAGYNNLPDNPDWTFDQPDPPTSWRNLSPSMEGTSTGVFKMGDFASVGANGNNK
jgi:RHS repeat-associated protein